MRGKLSENRDFSESGGRRSLLFLLDFDVFDCDDFGGLGVYGFIDDAVCPFSEELSPLVVLKTYGRFHLENIIK